MVKPNVRLTIRILAMALISLSARIYAQPVDSTSEKVSTWYLSLQFLGLTYHPDGGNTPELYPLKFDEKAYLVLDAGLAAGIDYRLSRFFFLRFTTTLYKDCAFVTAGCFHAGPRAQITWGRSSFNIGIGPIFSYRKDWHRFGEYKDDEFYGNRVYGSWQYRFFPTAIELEYLYRIGDSMELQYSLVPGAPLVITSMFGVRIGL
jgi:hypothetical protein